MFVFLINSPFVISRGQVKFSLQPGDRVSNLVIEENVIRGKFITPSFSIDNLEQAGNEYIRIMLDGTYPFGQPGMPELRCFSSLVELLYGEECHIDITRIDSSVIRLDEIFPELNIKPVQPPVNKKNIHGRDNLNVLSPAYFQTAEKPFAPVTMEYQGMMRGVAIGRIEVLPFRYMPSENVLTVYHHIEFTMVFEGPPAGMSKMDLVPAPFQRAMKILTRGEGSYRKKIIKDKPVTLVVLSDTMFRQTLKPLIRWKTEKGYRVIEAYTSDNGVGSSGSEIRQYMISLYDAPPEGYAPPSFLLIIGDVEHVPLSQSSGQITDLYYTTFDGDGDYLPEIFHGRISVKDTVELKNVIDKILMYEQYRFPDPAFLNRSILIAGYDQSYASLHGNGQINYASGYYFNASKGIDAHTYLHPEASSMDLEILQDISAGAAFVNYTGHGEYYGWLNPVFQMRHIDTMTNIHQYPLMIGNGCSTNQFNMSSMDCFAEAVLKVRDKGAIGYIGCTNYSYWDEDYYWAVGVGPITLDPAYENTSAGFYDKLFHTRGEPLESWSPSLGEMIFAGNMTVQESTSSKKQYYWEIYQLMGDPTLVPLFREPGDEMVTFPGQVPEKTSQIAVRAGPYDYVALSRDGNLLDARHADGFGQVYLQLPEEAVEGDMKIVVTGDKRKPFIGTISVSDNAAPFLEMPQYAFVEESVAEDGIISPGENFKLNMDLVLLGNSDVDNYRLILNSRDHFIHISDSVFNTGPLGREDTLEIEAAFMINMADNPEDQAPFTLSISATSSSGSNGLYIKEKAHSPVVVSEGIDWDDRPFGNGNGIIEQGEELLLNWKVRNTGSYCSEPLVLEKRDEKDSVMITEKTTDTPLIFPSEHSVFQLKATVNNTGYSQDLGAVKITASSGPLILEDSFHIITGRHFEDFSRGDQQRFRWSHPDVPWKPDPHIYSGGPFSLRSGTVSHNERTTLQIELNVRQVDSLLFDYRVSSEADYDYLRFYVDSIKIMEWSGNIDWQSFTYVFEPGNHLIEWRYQKDESISSGEDAGWIDNVVFPKHSFSQKDIALMNVSTPVSGRALGQSEDVRIELSNTGVDTIFGFSAGYRIDTLSWITEDFPDTLFPGRLLEIVFNEKADLSSIRTYQFHAGAVAKDDDYPGNDSLIHPVDHYAYPDAALEFVGIDSITSVYADLIIRVSNSGNIPLNDLTYTLYLDGSQKRMYTDTSMLDPGNQKDIVISLIQPEDSMIQGWYDYMVVSDPDSVLSNNTVSGSIFWILQSFSEAGIVGDLTLYPNPATEGFYIVLPENLDLPGSLFIYDPTGKRIHEERISRKKVVHIRSGITSFSGPCLVKFTDAKGRTVAGRIVILFP